MRCAPQIKIAATYMRGGTSKGVFFKLDDLPVEAQVPGKFVISYCYGSLVARTLMASRLMAWAAPLPVPVKP